MWRQPFASPGRTCRPVVRPSDHAPVHAEQRQLPIDVKKPGRRVTELAAGGAPGLGRMRLIRAPEDCSLNGEGLARVRCAEGSVSYCGSIRKSTRRSFAGQPKNAAASIDIAE